MNNILKHSQLFSIFKLNDLTVNCISNFHKTCRSDKTVGESFSDLWKVLELYVGLTLPLAIVAIGY